MNYYAVISRDDRVLAVHTSEHDSGHPDVVSECERLLVAQGCGGTWVYVDGPCQVGDVLDVDADGYATVRDGGES